MDSNATEALVQKYHGYLRELSGPRVKPVPPFLSIHGVDDDTVSIDHARKVLPMFTAMKPAAKVSLVLLGAGVHEWTYVDKDLAQGIIPAVLKLWHEAIIGGYYLE